MSCDVPEDFDPTTYLKINPDVADAGIDPTEHYLRFGRVEGRAYKLDFDSSKTPPARAIGGVKNDIAEGAEPRDSRLDRLYSFSRYLVEKRDNSQLPWQQVLAFNQFNRDRWVEKRAAKIRAGSKVLDVGAGTCLYKPLFGHCDYKSADLKKYEGLIDETKNEGLYGEIDYVCDITDLPVEDEVFDCVISTEVLEHVIEPIKAVEEMVRVLKKAGHLFLTAPLGSGLHQEPFHFYGGFTPHWYQYVAKVFSLDIIEISPNRGSFSNYAQECVRVRNWSSRHQHLHGPHVAAVEDMFGELLPLFLTEIDENLNDFQFTVGYHVHMVKR